MVIVTVKMGIEAKYWVKILQRFQKETYHFLRTEILHGCRKNPPDVELSILEDP